MRKRLKKKLRKKYAAEIRALVDEDLATIVGRTLDRMYPRYVFYMTDEGFKLMSNRGPLRCVCEECSMKRRGSHA